MRLKRKCGDRKQSLVFWVTLSALAVACNPGEQPVPPEPVTECKQYEQVIDRCFHRETKFSTQASLIPKNEADQERIKQLCLENLQRIDTACR